MQVNRPTVPEVLPLVRAYYAKPGNAVGGCLHVVLDDKNVHDDCVRRCLEQALATHDADGVALANKLLQMTKTQRLKLASLI